MPVIVWQVRRTETTHLVMSDNATSTSPAPARVGLLGYGTIGSSIHRLLVEHRDHIRHTTGRDVEVVAALVRDAGRSRDEVPGGAALKLTDDPDTFFAAQLDIVCEALGGLEPARTLVLRALASGSPVVTANKQLIARHGSELFDAAQVADVQLRFEASVCGAIPIIRMLRESLAAARIDSLQGILNGTTNYVLSAMADGGGSYDEALAAAQELGYAEPDPTDDVTGVDAAAKLAILAGIAFHTRVGIDSVNTTGITRVTGEDVVAADRLGCRVRLVGRARRSNGTMTLDVGPVLVPKGHPLAGVPGATNAVLLTGATFRELTVQGPGAGGPETASALAGDIVGVLGSTPSFLTRDPASTDVAVGDPELLAERQYVRLLVPDRAGVLARVAGSFAEQGTSIEQVIQQHEEGETASIVLTTHPAPRRDIRAALAAAGFGEGEGNGDGAGEAGQATMMAILEEPGR
jgi:homoserine dehydrogenase